MTEKILFQRGTIRVRRLTLAPGEAMPWHRDPFHRVTVILQGDALAIEYRESGRRERVQVAPGQVDWDEPSTEAHRGVNDGARTYEEITVFFLDELDAAHQPVEA